MTIETISLVVSLLEASAPALIHLHLDNGSGWSGARSLGEKKAVDLGPELQERLNAALDATQPTSLNSLQSLTINLAIHDEAECTKFMDWMPRFFGSSLSSSSLRGLEVRTPCLRQQASQEFIKKLCSLAGPSLKSLSLRGCQDEDSCPSALQRWGPAPTATQLSEDANIIKSLSQPLPLAGITGRESMSYSLYDTLETLKIEQIHGLLDQALAQELRKFGALTSLSLGDQLTTFGRHWIDGGWLTLENYEYEVDFIYNLPPKIQNVHLTLNAKYYCLDNRGSLLKDQNKIFKNHLRSLKQLYITCLVEGERNMNPLEEDYIHRLSGADRRSKRLAITHLGMGYQHHQHRAIHFRHFQDIELSDKEAQFEGPDEVRAWTYDENERDILDSCTWGGDVECESEPFELADPETEGETSTSVMNKEIGG